MNLCYFSLTDKQTKTKTKTKELYFGELVSKIGDNLTINGVLLDRESFPVVSNLPTDKILNKFENEKQPIILNLKDKIFAETAFEDSFK